jgi:uncharacterized membrane protein YeaQ/YmgE (transglycosylase-associated protein family)
VGFGLIGDLVLGIIGAFIGDWLLPRIGIRLGTGIVSAIINGTVGAVLLLILGAEFQAKPGGRLKFDHLRPEPFKGSGVPLNRISDEARGPSMSASERLLRFAAECEVMAKFSPSPENKVTWHRMAERWVRCAEVYERQDSSAHAAVRKKGHRKSEDNWVH